jgi:hypothetical protein
MSFLSSSQVRGLYDGFNAPIMSLNCGQKCAPYNGGVPYCCDTCHSVPTAYPDEWGFLQGNTDLWHLWEAEDPEETQRLKEEAGPNLVLIECQGHEHCQRDFRSLVCRAFPFYPYIDSSGAFLGLSYYWDYWERCWVISNLDRVSPEYRREFVDTFEKLFALLPDEKLTFANHSAEVRTVFKNENSGVPLLHLDGNDYYIDPFTEKIEPAAEFPKYEPYEIADDLLFEDEVQGLGSKG